MTEASDLDPTSIAGASELKPVTDLPTDKSPTTTQSRHRARIVRPKQVDLVLKFTGEMAEHGPHAPVLGPDGLIYVLMGDHSKPVRADDPGSPYHHAYEGDLISPRYEDPNGYGVGVKRRAGGSCAPMPRVASSKRLPPGFAIRMASYSPAPAN